MPGKMRDGLEDLRGEVLPIKYEGLHQADVGPGIASEGGGRIGKGTKERCGGKIAWEGVGKRDVRMDPIKAEALEAQGAKEGGAGGHGVDGGAGIMDEAGEGQLRGADGAARGFHGLENEDAEAGAGQANGGGEAIGAGADYDGIGGCHALMVPLMDAADRAGPGLPKLKDDIDAPDGKPDAEGDEGKDEVNGVVSPPPAKDAGEMAGAAEHGAALLVLPRDGLRIVGAGRISGNLRFPDRVFSHGGTVRGNYEL